MKELKKELIQLICDNLGVEEKEVTLQASFMKDLGADSLDTVELIMAFEQGFDLEIPDSDAEKFSTVGTALDYLAEKLGKKEVEN